MSQKKKTEEILLYPNKREVWERGVVNSINWVPDEKVKYVQIKFLPKEGTIEDCEFITKKTPNTGRYKFKVREDLKSENYSIVVEDLDGKLIAKGLDFINIPQINDDQEVECFDNPEIRIIKAISNTVITGSSAEISVKYTISNNGKSDTENLLLVPMQEGLYQNLPDHIDSGLIKIYKPSHSVIIPKDEEIVIEFYRTVEVNGDKVKTIQIDPMLLLNNKPYLAPVNHYEMSISLPDTAKKVLHSTQAMIQIQKVPPIIEKLTGESKYLFTEILKWTEHDVDIDIRKEVTQLTSSFRGSKNQFLVQLHILNNSNHDITDLTLVDSFPVSHVNEVSPENEFFIDKGDIYGIQLYWKKEIKQVRPKEEITFEYKIEECNYLPRLDGTKLLFKDSIVSISNSWINPKPYTPPPPPPPQYGVGIVPIGWSFDYTSKDHHINDFYMQTEIIDTSSDNLEWKSKVKYADKNFDDNYKWSASFSIFRILGAKIFNGGKYNIGGKGSDTENVVKHYPDLVGYKNAVIALRGWKFNFDNKDHHCDRIGMKFNYTNFNFSTGDIFFGVTAYFADKNSDDNYDWGFEWSVIGFNDGESEYRWFSGTDKGRSNLHQGSLTRDKFKGFQSALVLPYGWKYNFKNDDHHLNEVGFKITNVNYDSGTGKISWNAWLTYADKNLDDTFYWDYGVVILVFNDGESRVVDKGEYSSGGGYETKTYQEDINDIFVPITWHNGRKNGTETGIDCGGDSPSECVDCIKSSVNIGDASNAGYFSLKTAKVRVTAENALVDYANRFPGDYNAFYSGDSKSDRYIEAISWFVEEHMDYVKDSKIGKWSDAQSAKKTIKESGDRDECAKDYCGDCEDFAILRAGLLRSLKLCWKCVYCADHHKSEDQGQNDCPRYDKKGNGHTYNIVYYKGKYRIMDYHEITEKEFSDCWGSHATDNIWNDHYGEYWDKWNLRPVDGKLLLNYPGQCLCPTGNWNWRTYYKDICP